MFFLSKVEKKGGIMLMKNKNQIVGLSVIVFALVALVRFDNNKRVVIQTQLINPDSEP